jgi:hypothetical protein
MEQETRNKLQRATQQIRRILEDEFAEQLEGTFDILASGKILPEAGKHLDARQRLTRQKLVDAIEHIKANGKKPKEAVEDYTREAAFTFLNRCVALRMLEARGMLQECVAKGDQSSGFKEFCGLAPGLSSVDDGGYRLYLECLFDELSVEVKVLFDRRDSASLLWPRRGALNEVLEILAQEDLAAIWAIDETIGWVYQYHNDPDERKKMREESSAPRNSRELAVRNQFFTPRYVVEFLTDNTLGRIWYEMCQGNTRLKDQCRYLVRRPAEIFLPPGESSPETAETTLSDSAERQTQEELLRQPVHIPHRALKDPREIRLLDPACGSMHFGLYAFELFWSIYDEAWEIARSSDAGARSAATFAPFVTFAATFSNKASFLREVPMLIIQHNIHGIDIDPRAAQIANLAIWLRAQRSWHESRIDRKDRPRINRSNIVCAEPMPGEKGMLREFVEQQFPEAERPAFAFLLEKIFDKLSLAGEAGSLLQIEEEIRTAVTEAHSLARRQSEKRQKQLFTDTDQPLQQHMEFDLRGLTDEQFWDAAEQRIYDALEAYAEQAESGGGFQRRLFADDAAQGFAFIDLCRKRYDVVVMNPPFGAFPLLADTILNRDFADCRGDFYPSFMQRWGKRTELLGAITNRTGLTLSGLASWRISTLLATPRLVLLADLGMGVLDALVETALFVLSKVQSGFAITFDLLSTPKDRAAEQLLSKVTAVADGATPVNLFVSNPHAFQSIPGSPICYRIPAGFLATFAEHPRMERNSFVFRSTSPNYDDFRFIRLRWEAPLNEFGRTKRWSPLAKGGEYSPYYADIELLIDWDDKRQTFRGYTGSIHRPMERPACADIFFTPGITWSGRTASRFSPRVLPAGSIFSSKGPFAGGVSNDQLIADLGVMMSAPFQAYLELFVQAGDATSSGSAARDYQVGALRSVPDPNLKPQVHSAVGETTSEIVREIMAECSISETSGIFARWPVLGCACLAVSQRRRAEARTAAVFKVLSATQKIDQLVADAYHFGPAEFAYMESLFGNHPLKYPKKAIDEDAIVELFSQDSEKVIQNAVASQSTGRFITVKCYYADRHLEVVSHVLGTSPVALKHLLVERNSRREDTVALGEDLLSLVVGVIFGRWDVRYPTGERPAPELPDPFAPLPVCPPGMLQGDDGLPLSPAAGRRLRAENRYPLDVAWEGILVDDPEHPLDIERRVHAALAVIWGERADAIQQEACELLGVPTLREWFRRAASFFADHLKRYSKSRRKAPIYWPLSTPSATYTVWLYYHRFAKDTFFKVSEIVKEKHNHEQQKLTRFRSEFGDSPTRTQSKELETQEKVVAEIKSLLEEVNRIAPLWNPNLNDGVIINFAPLWRLVPQHRAWQTECKACWDKLVAGDYDWAHLAMHLWPERVVPKCVDDASLAIAHGLEEVFWKKDDRDRFQPKGKPQGGWKTVIDELVKERSSPAVKAALKSLLEAPVAASGPERGRGRRGAST